MTSKKELKAMADKWRNERNNIVDELGAERTAHSITQSNLRMAEKDRDKHLRQLQQARSAFETLKGALYPDVYVPAISPIMPAITGTLWNGGVR